MKHGFIFSMEEFAIHDGPGIRTTIFLKGCPLHCTWCHNPEGISPKPEYMIKGNERNLLGYSISSSELAKQILSNKEIYKLNNGGVTFTGGEPLFQADFVKEVIHKIKPHTHVAIETSGHVETAVFEETVSITNLVMMDIKHTDSAVHKRYTGVNTHLISKNLEHLCCSDIDFIIRIPLIPGVNDSEENMRAILSRIKGAKSLVRVELLPYHKTAGAKYSMVGKTYNPQFDTGRKPAIYNVFQDNNIKTIIL